MILGIICMSYHFFKFQKKRATEPLYIPHWGKWGDQPAASFRQRNLTEDRKTLKPFIYENQNSY